MPLTIQALHFNNLLITYVCDFLCHNCNCKCVSKNTHVINSFYSGKLALSNNIAIIIKVVVNLTLKAGLK